MNIIETKDIEKIFPDGTYALKKVSIKVYSGEFAVIAGSSGSGKSTLLRCMNFTVKPTSGIVLFRGADLNKANDAELRKIRCRIGVIYQQFNLIDRYSVLTNVLTGALGRQKGFKPIFGMWDADLKEEALDKLNIVGIMEKARVRTGYLSGGQQQRVAVARALMQNPDIILADEPVASLDPVTSEIVMNYLKEINLKYKITVICTLHSLDLAVKFAKRVIVLKHGVITFDGDVETFKNLPKDIVYQPNFQKLKYEEDKCGLN